MSGYIGDLGKKAIVTTPYYQTELGQVTGLSGYSVRVFLFNKRSKELINTTWSDATTGNYQFKDLDGNIKYMDITIDHTGTYPAGINDNVILELQP